MFPETTNLGASDIAVSRLGFGCWQLGGHGWQDLAAADLDAAVIAALDGGVTFFDTADVYGLGQSEETLGRLLKTHPKGDSAVIATKFGVRFGDQGRFYDNSAAWMNEAVDASRKRLQRDCIDLYQIHWHDGKRDIRAVFDDLEKLRASGKIRNYGLSNYSMSDWKKQDMPEGLVSFSFEYNLVARIHEGVIRHMQDNLGLTFLSWGSLAQGLLSGKYRRDHVFDAGDIRSRATSMFAAPHWDFYEPLLAAMHEIAQTTGRPMNQIALRWILDGVGGVTLAGIKNARHLNENAAAYGWHLPPEAMGVLNEASNVFLTKDMREP